MSEEILIGEGVLLDARPASFATRILAAVIDVLVVGIASVLVVTLAVSAAAFTLDDAAIAAVVISALAIVTVVVPTLVETLSRGRSLGKLVMGIRIVRDDGGPVRFRHAFVRALTGVLELWFTAGMVAILTSIVHPQGKRLGDLLAGTYPVRVRSGQKALPPVVMPPELARWAAHADMRRLPDGLALSARQLLGRADRLNLGSRARLGIELAGQVEAYVAPGPPPGTHPERFLAAVLAERRNREYAHAVEVVRRTAAETAQVERLPHGVPDPH
ncbi:RDD family protein [Actinotalea sp.]|uniref:RDD family protein n=1 Tax=Actinotalea sp. TaxID=1872145 RepID=UPI00356B339D